MQKLNVGAVCAVHAGVDPIRDSRHSMARHSKLQECPDRHQVLQPQGDSAADPLSNVNLQIL